MNEITLSKGSYSVIIYVPIGSSIADNYSKKLFLITPATSVQNQTSGVSPARVVDLLRATHQIVIRGYIVGTSSKSATEVKRDLVNIWKGAGKAGGEVTLTYNGNASAFGGTGDTSTTTIKGYVEKVTFIEGATDEPDDFESNPSQYEDVIKYEVSVTFVEGTQV